MNQILVIVLIFGDMKANKVAVINVMFVRKILFNVPVFVHIFGSILARNRIIVQFVINVLVIFLPIQNIDVHIQL
ncbi:hypothetical protein BLA29_006359 [Euroglyphus maynei]|uniref:Uncharacterized protein n=1 Tax=Euroglyphus maynei TaxID=6958 RepID=A0A1Y3ATX0_EURMA|nr:hypothetical protein BLA29_006359 [Euroglyphus maynei]